MLHINLNDGNSYGCSVNATNTDILFQLNKVKTGEQIRVMLTSKEAINLARYLLDRAGELEGW